MSSAKPPASSGTAALRAAASATGATRKVSIDDLRLAGGEGAPEGGAAFLHVFFQLFKTAQIHGIDNQALLRPIQNFIAATARLVSQEGRVSFQSKDRTLFQNSVKLKLSNEEYELAHDVFQFFDERGLGGFVIEGSLDPEGVRALLRILVYAPPAERKYPAIDAAVKALGLPFKVNKTMGGGKRSSAEVTLERRSYTFFTYSKLVVLLRGLLSEQQMTATRRQFLMKKVSRTVQALVDICLEDDHTFLGVSSVKSGEAYLPHHAANTAVLALSLGEKLGLRKVELADLGLAAALHDVGLRSVPAAVLGKAGELDRGERALVELGPLRAVEFLLGERSFTRSVLTQMVVAFEHHRTYEGGGYPRAAGRPDLFSRLVALACSYDALTTDRPWRKAFLPDEALGQMMGAAGKRFDPVLLKVFVNTLGLYPVGTLVRLDTGEVGLVVYGGGEGERALRPIVALLGADGRPGRTVDLAERSAGGGYLRTIQGSEDPARYGVQVSGLLAQAPAF